FRRQHPGTDRHEGGHGEDDDGEDCGAEGGSERRFMKTAEPACNGDGACGEHHGVGGKEVVFLAVHEFHHHEEDDEGEAEQTPAAGPQGPENADEPDGEEDGMEVEDLASDEGSGAEDDVFVGAADVFKVFERREVVADLPYKVRREEGKGDGDADPDPRIKEFAAVTGEQQRDDDQMAKKAAECLFSM